MFSAKELAPTEDQSVVFGIIQAAPNATLDQTNLFTEQVDDVYNAFPEKKAVFQITSPAGGFGGMVTKPWSDRKKSTEQLQVEASMGLSKIPGIRVISLVPPALPGGGSFPVDFVIASTAEPERLTEFANQLVAKAFESGVFMYADSDLKFDQPQAEVVFDRDKLRVAGRGPRAGGPRPLDDARRQLRQPLHDPGPQLQGHPAGQARRAPQRRTALRHLRHGRRTASSSRFRRSPRSRPRREPRELKRFQQLNAVRVQGVIPPGVPLDAALKVLEAEAAMILPKGFTVDYAGESRQLRDGRQQQVPRSRSCCRRSSSISSSRRSSRASATRSSFSRAPCRWRCRARLLFSFLGFTTLNIYSQVGLITLVGLIAKNGILIVEFANKLQEQGRDKLHAVIEAAETRLRPILMTTAATVMGHMPLVFASGPGAGARNSIGIMLVTGMIIGTVFTLFVVPSIYVLVAKTHKKIEDVEAEPGVPELKEAAV